MTGEVAWKVIIGRGTSGYGEALRGLTGFLRKVR
ncbi:MAG: hypothetical protein KKB90_08040 [Actinobacteria bacterium]|nr:hypothetical protein [Actinomycetota bacterium]MBU4218895.1 hypothetical protein [Actinomycetota bacterium]MBU4359285.1 hypothetical protein [Actinomycetota bacterium]MBU4390938.1 hypothetical protein [Actinomycetota bacterium]MBU4403131.1 hypothetical protein [Actinomycetota bacterium]